MSGGVSRSLIVLISTFLKLAFLVHSENGVSPTTFILASNRGQEIILFTSSATRSHLRMASSLRCERNLHTQSFRFHFLTFFFFFRPAGGSFQVELADNQAHTTLSYGGKFVSEYINGGTYDSSNPVRFSTFSSLSSNFSHFETPVQYNYKNLNGGCITNPNSTRSINFFFSPPSFLTTFFFFFLINQCTHRISLTQLVLLSLSHMWYVFFAILTFFFKPFKNTSFH